MKSDGFWQKTLKFRLQTIDEIEDQIPCSSVLIHNYNNLRGSHRRYFVGDHLWLHMAVVGLNDRDAGSHIFGERMDADPGGHDLSSTCGRADPHREKGKWRGKKIHISYTWITMRTRNPQKTAVF